MPESVESLRNDLRKAREGLLAAIAGVSEEQFKRRPEGGWCIAEVLAHLLASDRLRAARITVALERDGETIEPSDPAAHEAEARAGRASPVPQLIHGLLAVYRQAEQLLDRAATLAGGLERGVLHPVNGRQTVAWMLREKVIDHEAEHTAQIEAIKAVLGTPLPPTPSPPAERGG